MAATRALATLAKEPVPEAVARAYGLEALEFGRDYLIPKPFDGRVLLWVASAVAEAAIRTGVARQEIDLTTYRDALEARLGRAREVMRGIVHKAARDPKRVVFPEATHERILRAVEAVLDEGIARPILVGDPQRIAIAAGRAAVDLDWDRVEVADPAEHPRRDDYIEAYYRARHRKGITRAEAEARLARPICFAAAMVNAGDADALIAGQEMHYPEALRPCLETVGVDPASTYIAGLYMMVLEQDLLFFADTTVNIEPDTEILAEIARLAAGFVKNLGIEPKVAMLSFSNFGSARHPRSRVVADATRIVKDRSPDLIVDGEMQADTAVVPDILRRLYPFSELQDRANVLIFPNLDAANIAYKLLARLGHAEAIGPVLLGMARPIHILQRGCDVSDIVNLTAIAVVDAQKRIADQRVLDLGA
ncbi:MAG: phosphate acyltransferase [Gemmatimonadota bacterium]